MNGLKQPDLSLAGSSLRAPQLAPSPPMNWNGLGTLRGAWSLLRGGEDPAFSVFRSGPFRSSRFSAPHQIVQQKRRAAPWRAQPVGPDTWYEVRTTSVVVHYFA